MSIGHLSIFDRCLTDIHYCMIDVSQLYLISAGQPKKLPESPGHRTMTKSVQAVSPKWPQNKSQVQCIYLIGEQYHRGIQGLFGR